MNSMMLQWIEIFISGGVLIAVCRVLIVAGRVLQKLDDHDDLINGHSIRLAAIEKNLMTARAHR